MKLMIGRALALATLTIASLSGTEALAQAYPSKPIRLIAPYPPGGGVDATARIVAGALSEALGQQVVVDNRGGASGQIGTEIAAQTAADGYTLLLGSVAPNAIIPAANPKLPYDAVKDFAPVSLVAESDYILAVHPSLPVKSVPQLVALAKAHPGQIAFASTGNLGGPHLAGELFKQLAKVDMVHVAYKGGGPATTSILSGETSLIFGSGPTVVPHAKVGRLRLVATTGPKRSKVLPDLPTVGETLPGHEVTQWYGILVPAKTPTDIVSRLNAELVKALATPKAIEQLERLGTTSRTTTPAEFSTHIKAEIAKWSRVVKSANIKPN
jgi:tripartite-type tricarboxylate transporter receptor subunit TctC